MVASEQKSAAMEMFCCEAHGNAFGIEMSKREWKQKRKNEHKCIRIPTGENEELCWAANPVRIWFFFGFIFKFCFAFPLFFFFTAFFSVWKNRCDKNEVENRQS